MDLVTLVLTLVCVGFVLWFINTFVPMEPRIKQILNVSVIILVMLWLLVTVLGITNLGTVRVN